MLTLHQHSRNELRSPSAGGWEAAPVRYLTEVSMMIRRVLFLVLLIGPVLIGQTPKEQVRYSPPADALTDPSERPPTEIALGFLCFLGCCTR